MSAASQSYAGRILEVDLTRKTITEKQIDPDILKTYIGGTGIGARLLYDNAAPPAGWSDPGNVLAFATGPLAGTRMAGSGTFSVVTRGPLTGGATATQANGYFGAFLRFNNLVGIAVRGASDKWVYLHVHDGTAELRDASSLVGLDTWDTEAAIKKELGASEHQMSVYGVGPAGENLVKFAGILGDRGHAAAHNGSGAVMGAKKLKAVAVSRGKGELKVADAARLSELAQAIHQNVMEDRALSRAYEWGTSMNFRSALATGVLPIKNLNTSFFPDYEPFNGENYRKAFEIKPSPCWACGSKHLHIVKVLEGPYAGYIGEEPEYECWAAWGPLIGQHDPAAAVVLSNTVDRLGMDTNEAGWLIAFVIDCYERGILTKKDTDGLEMTWGNVPAVLALLGKIARRDGFGDILAEGIKRSAERLGGEALKHAVYTQKGHAPRGHDHRARWIEMLDYATSNEGTIETGAIGRISPDLGVTPLTDPFSPEQVPYVLAKGKPMRQFVDCLGICNFSAGNSFTRLVDIVNAATGWDLILEEAVTGATRIVNLLRVFNVRCGIGPEVEAPSVWYSSVPVDGPAQGKDVKPHWEQMLDSYYKHMGWDRKSARPLSETLRRLGLEKEARDIW